MQTYLITYDISDNNLRLKASRLLLRAGGFRLQYSVFMGTYTIHAYRKLRGELDLITKKPRWQPENSILIVPLHQYSKDELHYLGINHHDWPLIYRELHTLVV